MHARGRRHAGAFFGASEQIKADGFDTEADHAIRGCCQRWGPTLTFSDTPGRYDPGVLAGEQTDAILADVAYGADGIAWQRGEGIVFSEEPVVLSAPSAA